MFLAFVRQEGIFMGDRKICPMLEVIGIISPMLKPNNSTPQCVICYDPYQSFIWHQITLKPVQ